ncbi:MAG: diphosphomevalonate decarboxylase [Chloroflexi bacterium RBG_16_57_11]|nr:MAG: diphosphomevalonate decarboxylase [Chloroflexi bacterium RBG_16_57_11]
MSTHTVTAQSCANIAFIKYWGNRDHELRIPSNGSISMNLGGLYTHTRVTFDPGLRCDELVLDGQIQAGAPLERVSAMLDRVRRLAGLAYNASVQSSNNFPMGVGIASSASAFAALSLAASRAADLALDEAGLSRLARTGSGSACRSVPGGFVEWRAGNRHEDSYAYSLAPPEHWALVDCVAIVSREHKSTGSSEGHPLAYTSPFQTARVDDAPRRLGICRQAILDRDFDALADIVELDNNLMHGVIMTSSPRILYWQPATLTVMHAVTRWRTEGLPVCYTIDAGPNVHVICRAPFASEVAERLKTLPGIEAILTATPGGPAQIINED